MQFVNQFLDHFDRVLEIQNIAALFVALREQGRHFYEGADVPIAVLDVVLQFFKITMMSLNALQLNGSTERLTINSWLLHVFPAVDEPGVVFQKRRWRVVTAHIATYAQYCSKADSSLLFALYTRARRTGMAKIALERAPAV